jgi:hypothetical protein
MHVLSTIKGNVFADATKLYNLTSSIRNVVQKNGQISSANDEMNII